MQRKLIVIMAVAGLISTGSALGLGLGKITVNSSLNQVLNADIELIQAMNLSNPEIIPRLATRDDFRRIGIERSFTLSDLIFETHRDNNGVLTIRVTSKKPVVEPVLNFLIEVHWPHGRLMREYTLLLDPPSFSSKIVGDTSQKTFREKRHSEDHSLRTPDAVAPVKSSLDHASSSLSDTSNRLHTVKKDETLWDIALIYRSEHSALARKKMMQAIQLENPDAFVKGDRHKLKHGSVLRIPDLIESVGKGLVARQNVVRPGSVRQIDATKSQTTPEKASMIIKDDGRLTVVSFLEKPNEDADQGEGGKGSIKSKAFDNDLAVNSEEIDALTRERAENEERLSALSSQLETLDRLISLKNNELAAMQREGQSDRVLSQPSQPPQEVMSDDIDYNYQSDSGILQDEVPQNVTSMKLAKASPKDIQPSVVPDKKMSGVEQQQETSFVDQQKVTSTKPAQVSPQNIQPSALLDESMDRAERRQKASFFDQLGDMFLYVMWFVGGILFIVAGVMFVVRRRAQSKNVSLDDQDELSPEYSESVDSQDSLDDQDKFAPTGSKQVALGNGVNVAEQSTAAVQPSELDVDLDIDQKFLESRNSVMDEVDICVDYGRFEHAFDILKRAIASEPGDNRYRLKLMELQADQDDLDGFREQMALLGADIDDATQLKVAGLKSRFADAPSKSVETADALKGSDELSNLDLDISIDSAVKVKEISQEIVSSDGQKSGFDLIDASELLANGFTEIKDNDDVGELNDDLNVAESSSASDDSAEIAKGSLEFNNDSIDLDDLAIDDDDDEALEALVEADDDSIDLDDLAIDDDDDDEALETLVEAGDDSIDLDDLAIDDDDDDEALEALVEADDDSIDLDDLVIDDDEASEALVEADDDSIDLDDLVIDDDDDEASEALVEVDDDSIDLDDLVIDDDDDEASEALVEAGDDSIDLDDLVIDDDDDEASEALVEADDDSIDLDDLVIDDDDDEASEALVEVDDDSIDLDDLVIDDDDDEASEALVEAGDDSIDLDDLVIDDDDDEASEALVEADDDSIDLDDLVIDDDDDQASEALVEADDDSIDLDDLVIDDLDDDQASKALVEADDDSIDLDDLAIDDLDDDQASEALVEADDDSIDLDDLVIDDLDDDQASEALVEADDDSIDLDDLAIDDLDDDQISESLALEGVDLSAENGDGLVTIFSDSDDKSVESIELNAELDLHEEMESLDSDLSDLSEELGGVDIDAALQLESVNVGEEPDLDRLDLDSALDDDSLGEDTDFLEKTDEIATQLDLARAYIEMGDQDGAKDILKKVIQEGSDVQKQEADELLKKL